MRAQLVFECLSQSEPEEFRDAILHWPGRKPSLLVRDGTGIADHPTFERMPTKSLGSDGVFALQTEKQLGAVAGHREELESERSEKISAPLGGEWRGGVDEDEELFELVIQNGIRLRLARANVDKMQGALGQHRPAMVLIQIRERVPSLHARQRVHAAPPHDHEIGFADKFQMRRQLGQGLVAAPANDLYLPFFLGEDRVQTINFPPMFLTKRNAPCLKDD